MGWPGRLPGGCTSRIKFFRKIKISTGKDEEKVHNLARERQTNWAMNGQVAQITWNIDSRKGNDVR